MVVLMQKPLEVSIEHGVLTLDCRSVLTAQLNANILQHVTTNGRRVVYVSMSPGGTELLETVVPCNEYNYIADDFGVADEFFKLWGEQPISAYLHIHTTERNY